MDIQQHNIVTDSGGFFLKKRTVPVENKRPPKPNICEISENMMNILLALYFATNTVFVCLLINYSCHSSQKRKLQQLPCHI